MKAFEWIAMPVMAFAGIGLVAVFGQFQGTSTVGKPNAPKSETSGLFQVKGNPKPTSKTQLAMFGAGCFWGVENEFRKEPGVIATAVGYAGGHVKNPTYKEVCTDTTGHAEVVRIEFDPKVISYKKLCEIFWDLHDPTTPNRQGPDVGSQYRSAIFTMDENQKKVAIETKNALAKSGELSAPIVTEIVPDVPFYFAENYHQQYVEKGGIAFCHRRKKG